nr:hypothetical protein [Mucilaginibacter humi]
MRVKESLGKLFIADNFWIIVNLHNFGVAGSAGANIFVSWVFSSAPAKPDTTWSTPFSSDNASLIAQKHPPPNVATARPAFGLGTLTISMSPGLFCPLAQPNMAG